MREAAIESDAVGVFVDATEAGEAADVEDVVMGKRSSVLTAEGSDVNVREFETLCLDAETVEAVQEAWRLLLAQALSREAAGEAIYSALFESAPSLRSLFTTPRAVQAMRFVNGIASLVGAVHDPPGLKVLVETLSFGHLQLDVTVPRVAIFRIAIMDLLGLELGERFSPAARHGWSALLNYVGGAIIYVKTTYAGRIATLLASWGIAKGGSKQEDAGSHDNSPETTAAAAPKEKKPALAQQSRGATGGLCGSFRVLKDKFWSAEKSLIEEVKSDLHKLEDLAEKGLHELEDLAEKVEHAAEDAIMGHHQEQVAQGQNVPRTYSEMFRFNAAVMGFGNNVWFQEVLDCFDNIVINVANSSRLQEECDILNLRIVKGVAANQVNLQEYKSCMLASLRSLLPSVWSTDHEVAWAWLWDNVERILKTNMHKLTDYAKSLAKVLGSFNESSKYDFRASIYARFFTLSPSGQDFFKQSTTYLHVIADKIIDMVLDIHRDPFRMVDDISALGLRHVGYAIPTEQFGPFVSACVEMLAALGVEAATIESFSWSLALVAKMLVRTITEGSTVVMKAINVNAREQLQKAIACAPRCARAEWFLKVQVGTQNISPLEYAVRSGSIECADDILKDLLTIRADRERYYYGMEELFNRHPFMIKLLVAEAPALNYTLFDGLIWRSALAIDGNRRVNYYIRELLLKRDGSFSAKLEWIGAARDPKLVCHPLVKFLVHIVWSRLARRTFLMRKTWLLLNLAVFILGQAIWKYVDAWHDNDEGRSVLFACRLFTYGVSMTYDWWLHIHRFLRIKQSGEAIWLFGRIPIPTYLKEWQEACHLALASCLLAMLFTEQLLWCWQADEAALFTVYCDQYADAGVEGPNTMFCLVAMVLYFFLITDLSVCSDRIAAFRLVLFRMFGEFCLFLGSLFFVILVAAAAVSALQQNFPAFQGMHVSALSLFQLFLFMFEPELLDGYLDTSPLVFFWLAIFVVGTNLFFLNILVAQLICAYQARHEDMLGHAELERISMICSTMPKVNKAAWGKFVLAMQLHQPVDFNEGDVGVSGGVQIFEPAGLHPTVADRIKRFGGSTSPEQQWPVEDEAAAGQDRFERLEKLLQKILKHVVARQTKADVAEAQPKAEAA